MISYRQIVQFVVVISSVFLVACASSESTRNGPAIEIFPVSHALSLRVDKTSLESAKQELDIYLEEYADILVTQKIMVSWSGKDSKKLADFAVKSLLSMGVAPNYIDIKEISMDTTSYFDFEIKVVQYLVADKTCKQSKSQDYYLSDVGCFTENARWKSMVTPERMLSNFKQTQE